MVVLVSMKKIIIVGAGSFAREVCGLIKRINAVSLTYELLGMLDDNEHALDGIACDCRIIGRLSNWVSPGNVVYALGIATPQTKYEVIEKLKGHDFMFDTLIEPTTSIHDYVEIGNGTIIGGKEICENARIGDFVTIAGSMIGPESTLGSFSTTTGYVNVASGRIGERTFVGSHAVILSGVSVGKDCTIGAGCIISRDIPDGCTAFMPAPKVLKTKL